MIIHTLWITRKGDSYPELIAAWDDETIAGYHDGWVKACDEALDSIGSDLDEKRYIRLTLPDDAIAAHFASPTVAVEVQP